MLAKPKIARQLAQIVRNPKFTLFESRKNDGLRAVETKPFGWSIRRGMGLTAAKTVVTHYIAANLLR